ncbi:uncharacterized protein LOC129318161 isoform X1 [Prosopis cineraria]|uniref:uncharacterized protein LOC129318161 isoform X1 n=1 Tax=Prosopis cineraria TaxID=364024 RepID=UPI0024101D61|nr:uncharacterized protein LOC129318161 isoform X1 [Prosopis cineraria]XP_054818751.1 uncharacterized protein LOC129318161 isoform X1 [Prosopis cineraria]
MKQQLEAQVKLIDMLLKGQIPGRLLGDVSPSGKDSCTVPSDKIPEGENDCNCLADDPSRKVVATGHMYNIAGDTIHNLPLLPDCIRVSLLVAIGQETVGDEMQTVGDALGSFIAWPSHLVMVGTLKLTKDPKPSKDPLPPKKKPRGKSKLKGKVSGHTKESVTVSQHTVPMPVVENKFHDSLETYASAMRMICQEPIGDIINFDDVLFGRASFEVVRDEILNEILKHDMASTSLMTSYMSHLYTSFVVPGSLELKIKLVNPHDVSPHNNITKEALENQARMLSDQFQERGAAKDTLFLAPYCQRGHWMLIVVNPVAPKIWYLDPLNGKPSNRKDMVVLFNEAVVLYRTATDMTMSPKMRAFESSEKWVTIKCPF